MGSRQTRARRRRVGGVWSLGGVGRWHNLHPAVLQGCDLLRREGTRLAPVVLPAVLEPYLHARKALVSTRACLTRGCLCSTRQELYFRVRRTWTSFSLRETRLTMSRRAALSGLGFALYAASRMALSLALRRGLAGVLSMHIRLGIRKHVQHTRSSFSCPLGVARRRCFERMSLGQACRGSRRRVRPSRPCCGMSSSKAGHWFRSAAAASLAVVLQARARAVGST